ncbi:DUF6231 family protein [Stutzerimonas stutzeri]|uniref:DUF6231 family protein n=1 Tax=Stutzerimonas sp. S1 TaxID=3030652 RepID=UPI0022255664|nr:DUF6231 family protein [Stutzerimonas sp. S1]MCW3149081.1 DUF6231 family protein [Stutzerimonas sp. S1]
MIAHSHTPQRALAALLDHYQPDRVLHVGQSLQPALDAFAQSHPGSQVDHAVAAPLEQSIAQRRYDLALVVDCLEHLPKRNGLELLGGIRNLNASRMAVLIDLAASDWQATDFFSLGLQISDRFQREAQTLTLFTYDLLEYKQVPDWLNAKFWANPQMFGKYWW